MTPSQNNNPGPEEIKSDQINGLQREEAIENAELDGLQVEAAGFEQLVLPDSSEFIGPLQPKVPGTIQKALEPLAKLAGGVHRRISNTSGEPGTIVRFINNAGPRTSTVLSALSVLTIVGSIQKLAYKPEDASSHHEKSERAFGDESPREESDIIHPAQNPKAE